jgi:hypothetical protein
MPGPLRPCSPPRRWRPWLDGLTASRLYVGRLGLLIALATAASCGARAADPSEVSGLFDRAVDCFGEPYLRARARLTHPSTNARAMLLRESRSPDVQRELTARILLGWIDHEDDFRTVADYIHGRRRVPRPLQLFGPGSRREALLFRRGRYAADVTPHAYLWMFERDWKVRDLDHDEWTSFSAGLTMTLRGPDEPPPLGVRPPDRALAMRLWEFARLDGATRRGREESADADILWGLFQRAERGDASIGSRLRLANLYAVLVSPGVVSVRRPLLVQFYDRLLAGALPPRLREAALAGREWALPGIEDMPHPANSEYRLRQRTAARRAILMRPLRTCPGP